jgi:CBS-domain-containing membrane protein
MLFSRCFTYVLRTNGASQSLRRHTHSSLLRWMSGAPHEDGKVPTGAAGPQHHVVTHVRTPEAQTVKHPSPVRMYWNKFKATSAAPPALKPSQIVTNGLSALLGFAAISLPVHMIDGIESVYLIASFGASAALLYGMPDSPFSQPRNVVGGHVVSALVGVTAMDLTQFLDFGVWFSAPIAVAGAVMAMQTTRTFHPPAAGTALTAVIGSSTLHALGYSFVFMPCAIGSSVLVLTAVLVNNLIPGRQYPKYWW